MKFTIRNNSQTNLYVTTNVEEGCLSIGDRKTPNTVCKPNSKIEVIVKDPPLKRFVLEHKPAPISLGEGLPLLEYPKGVVPTLILNFSDAPDDWRDRSHYVFVGGRGGCLDNQFNTVDHTPEKRLSLFAEYAFQRFEQDPDFATVVRGLQGRCLLTFGVPKEGLTANSRPIISHAQFLAYLADKALIDSLKGK